MRKIVHAGGAALAIVVLAGGVAWALHRQTPIKFPITAKPGGNSHRPFTEGAVSRFITFESTSDLLGNGSSGPEVFLYDLAPPRSMAQVTNFPVGESRNPSVDAGGQTVAFDSTADILNIGNTTRQIFTWNRHFGTYRQITFGTAPSQRPVVNFGGDDLVFESEADLLGSGGPTGQTNIFLWTSKATCDITGCKRMHQITKPLSAGPWVSGGARWSREPAANYVIFHSNAPLLGPSNGFHQIYLYHRSTRFLEKLTNGNGDSINASIDNNGRMVTFQSRADLLANGSSGWEIFRLDRETGQIVQITNTPFGDSTQPSIATDARWIAFVSTGDVLASGSVGQQLFLHDAAGDLIYQVTNDPRGDVSNPVATNENLFFFDSTQDFTQTGLTGRQVYVFNVFQALGTPSLGGRTFRFDPLTSQIRLTTRAGVLTAPVTEGSIAMTIGARNFEGEAPVRTTASGFRMSPIEVPGFGAVCLTATGDGTGLLDCNGGRPDGDVSVSQDHDTDLSDPLCLLGCREGAACQGQLQGPHVKPCPFCGPAGQCVGGISNGAPCASHEACAPQAQCTNGQLGVCNGPPNTSFTGTFGIGGMVLTIPVRASLSTDPGPDRNFCTGDDIRKVTDVDTYLRLSTGVTSQVIFDADNLSGEIVTSSDLGIGFECTALANNFMTGARLCGGLTLLDVPNQPGLRDLIISFCLQDPCTGGCPQPCATSAECDDFNPCNGVEACVAGHCRPGQPIICNNGDICDGAETCNPATGSCMPGAPLDCDDGNGCTAEACNPLTGCEYTNVTGGCDDGNLCTTGDTCLDGVCVGAPISCPDADVCDGVNVCDPGNGLCTPAPAPDCDDGNPCTDDSCHPILGCQHTNNTSACDDGSLCTFGDVCANGTCAGTPVTCADPDPCDGVETCDPGTGGCIVGPPPTCDDGNVCTDESCVSGVGCVYSNNSAPCDDGEPCTTGDVCIAGACTGMSTFCDDGNACNGVETCNAGTGLCVAGTPVPCDDADSCTLDACVAGVCGHGGPTGFEAPFCYLDALLSRIGTAPGNLIQGRRLPLRLGGIIVKARSRLERAQATDGPLRRQMLRRTSQRLLSFIRTIERMSRRNKVHGALAAELSLTGHKAQRAVVELLDNT